jgi:TPR repeat protein
MYSRGIGVEVNPAKAVELLQKASKLGDPTGIVGLAYCYTHGIGEILFAKAI